MTTLANSPPRLPSLRALLGCLALFAPARAASAQAASESCQPAWLPTFGIGQSTDNAVTSLAVLDDGSGPALFVGGPFTVAGGVPANHVARWDGTSWSALGSGTDQAVRCLAVFDDGGGPALYAGGEFTSAGGGAASFVARWDGTSWSALGAGVDGWVLGLAVFDDGSGPALYAGGLFSHAGGVPAARCARWNGSSWSALGSGMNQSVHVLSTFDDGGGAALYAGGEFTSAGGAPASRIARWNGASWSALGSGVNSWIVALSVFDDGGGPALYAGGQFTIAGGAPANRLARWDGASWAPLGSGVDFPAIPSLGSVRVLSVFDDGGGPALVAGGFFSVAGGAPASYIAQWRGSAWSPLGGGVSGTVDALALFDDGSGAALVAGGGFADVFDSGDGYLGRWGCPSTTSEPFCFGDGSGAPCPCANAGAVAHGCENSAATGGARLAGSGTTYPDTLVLGSSGELASALSIFLQGDLEIPPAPFGDGLRCAGGNLKRLFVENAVAGTATAPGPGDPRITEQSALLGDPIAHGSTRLYQVYYRDPDQAFCPSPAGNSWNASNGLRVTW